MTEVTKPKPKKPPRLYRVALVSEDLRFKLAEAVTGNCQRSLIGTPGAWWIRDFVLSDHAVRHHIKELSGVIYEDERPYPSWAALEQELINEPSQIAWRDDTRRIARERAREAKIRRAS